MNYPFTILRPTLVPARLDNLSILSNVGDSPEKELSFLFQGRKEPMALDIETKGSNPIHSQADSHVVGVGLSDSRGSIYISVRDRPDIWNWIIQELVRTQVPLLMHNAFYDLAFIRRDLLALGIDAWPNLLYCTYALFRLTSTEDWPGFSWSLKSAQTNLLLWAETNEQELDMWLLRNGHIRNVKKLPEDSPEPKEGDRWGDYLWLPGMQRFAAPQKDQMYLAPVPILGHYCCLDADSTWLFYQYILKPVLDKFRGLKEYCSPAIYGEYIKLMIEQRRHGISIDLPAVKEHLASLQTQLDAAEKELAQHPDFQAAASLRKEQKLAELTSQEPEQFRKFKLGQEPVKYTKAGTVSKSWESWNQKKEKGPEVSKNWLKWEESVQLMESLPAQNFLNIQSGQQRQWFFYDYLKYPILLRTESGQPATDKNALKGWGEIGKLLQKQNRLVKEMQYTEAVIRHTIPETERLHPSFRVPGTSSGRLAGAGGVNSQQMPKSFGLLNAFRASPGTVLVEMDFTALESVIMTELSRDASMLKLYGPDANPYQDIHLFTGSHLPGIGDRIRKAGYDPENPTQEGVDRAKKECKKEREISKTLNYASVYSAGGAKIAQTLTLGGIPTSLEEGKKLHAAYWETYRGVKEYSRELERQWNLNDGWFLNGIGRPVSIIEDRKKDVLSKSVQATGHDCLVLLLTIYWKHLRKEGIPAKQWGEFHDQLLVEVPEEYGERARYLLQEVALPELNRLLGGLIPLKGEAQVIRTLAEAKGLKANK
jgi:hypothetical protein